jgi:hypothetical protein
MLDLAVLKHQSQFSIVRATIVADGSDVFRAFARHGLDQIVRKTRASEAAEHDSSPIGNVRDSGVQIRVNFLFHGLGVSYQRRYNSAGGPPDYRAKIDQWKPQLAESYSCRLT